MHMKIRTLFYFARQALVSIWRHGWMSIASVLTVAIALTLFGAFLLLTMNLDMISHNIETNLEIVTWVKVDAGEEEVSRLGRDLQGIPGVRHVQFVPKEKGLQKMNEQFGPDHDLVAALGGENPLPDYYIIRVDNVEMVKEVARTIERLDPVEKVDYGENVLDKLLTVLHWVKRIGLGLVIMLGLAGLFLVAITIRLTVYARSEEIGIMKYVGATNWFVRWPFIIEGMILGLVGSVLAAGAIFYGYVLFMERLAVTISFIPFFQDYSLLWRLCGYMVAAGTLLGAIGSFISLGKYLKV